MRRRQILREYEMARRRAGKPADAQPANQVPLEQLPDDVLAAMYKQKYGKAPHHRMKRSSILERLNDALQFSA